MPSWKRLIRFSPTSDPTKLLYGEPVADNYDDIGALADSGKLRAKVVVVGDDGPLAVSAEVTDRMEDVGRLLSPLSSRDCPGIKCIGLNYKKHSK